MSTWTPSSRRWSSATIRAFAGVRSRWGMPPRAASSLPPATRRRTFGVKSALPSVTAMRRCPDLVFVPPRFDVYRMVSQQIHAIFAEFTDLIQPLSLDEAYLDVTANRKGLPTAWLTAKAIRARILDETGLTASAGISYNKFLAKLASDHRKPDGQFAVTPDMGAAWIETLPVSRFHGVGPVTAAKMERLGITTGADLRAKSMDFLIDHFGSSAGWYHAIARARTTGRSIPTACVSRRGPRPPSIAI